MQRKKSSQTCPK